MPTCTGLGVKSSTSDADGSWCPPPQPATARQAMAAADAASRRRTGGQHRRRLESPPSMRRRVTFSRNVTLSLSRTCRCYCKYCAFATHQPHLHEPDEVLAILDQAVARHRAKELLVLTGEKPEHNAGVAARLASLG